MNRASDVFLIWYCGLPSINSINHRVKVTEKSIGSIHVVIGPLADSIVTRAMTGGAIEIPGPRQLTTTSKQDKELIIADGTGLALPGIVKCCARYEGNSVVRCIALCPSSFTCTGMTVISSSSLGDAFHKAAAEGEEGVVLGQEKEWQVSCQRVTPLFA